MSDIDSDEEKDQLSELQKLSSKIPRGMFVSGWDDENDLIETEENPHETQEKELLWAATEDKIEIVEKILNDHPELVNVRDRDGYTPLHKACYNNNYEMAQLLLRFNADIEAQTEMEWTPLHSAAKWNNAKLVALLLQHGANINALSEGNNTPLHVATTVSSCRDTLIELFMNDELNPGLLNSSDETAAQIAKRTGLSYAFFEMVKPGLDPKIGMLD
uniref:CSON001140 protein n=1 Tax=Culicoides sonorensis TaxID=179676 RepID=A0A336MKV2_CULSO